MKRNFSIFFVGLFLIQNPVSSAQDYLWPTDASRLMTSSFGEYRDGHVHAGLDIKTWGQEGFKCFALDHGSITAATVSPYGYGRAVYLKLDDGCTVIYAHLSAFPEPVEEAVRKEQIRKSRFSVICTFERNRFPVRKGDVVGISGASGNGVPHLHMEIREPGGKPVNPLLAGLTVADTRHPTISAVAVVPLSEDSHVDGDFIPRIYPARWVKRDRYVLDETIRTWGSVGLSVSVSDRANGAENPFSSYMLELFLDDSLLFRTVYDTLDNEYTKHVDLDRDYRLKQWGSGLFQNLYKARGNRLDFYTWAGAEEGRILSRTPGVHTLRIVASDYFGNSSQVTGRIRLQPLEDLAGERALKPASSTVRSTESRVDIQTTPMERWIRFRLFSQSPLAQTPALSVSSPLQTGEIPLIPRSAQEFVGMLPWDPAVSGSIFLEAKWPLMSELEQTTRSHLELFGISDQGGQILSPDGKCQIVFSRGSVYGSLIGRCEMETLSADQAAIGQAYRFIPNDVLLKRRVLLQIDVPDVFPDPQRLGVGRITSQGISYIGGEYEEGALSAWISELGAFTLVSDTLPPAILFVMPKENSRVDPDVRIAVGFSDNLSGISGEQNYTVCLDGQPLILELFPSQELVRCPWPLSLPPGEHTLEITLRDRAGNVTTAVQRFTVVLDQ